MAKGTGYLKIIKAISCAFFIIFAIVPLVRTEDFKYESRGRRDPFIPLIGQEKPAATALEDVTSAEDLKLEGIAVGAKGARVAIINGTMMKKNDKIAEVELKDISANSITVLISGKEYILNIVKEGESQGE